MNIVITSKFILFVILTVSLLSFWVTPLQAATPINVAAQANGGVASASSIYSASFPVRSVNDGDRKGLNWGNGGGWNDATANQYPDWVQITFAGAQTIGEIDVFTLQDNYTNPMAPTPTLEFSQYGITAFQVEYWNGANWVTVSDGSVTGNNKVWRQFMFAPVTTDHIRVLVKNSLGYGYSRIVEVEAYTSTDADLPPAVSLSTPANNLIYTAPASITIIANASDSDGTISKVEFYWGSTLLNTDTGSPYSFNWANVPAGNYSLIAKAYDNLGASTVSTPVAISVNPASGTAEISVNRPTVTINGSSILVNWDSFTNATGYVIYYTNNISGTGPYQSLDSISNEISIPLATFDSLNPLYFSVAPIVNGIELQKSQWAYLVKFSDIDLGFWGAIAIGDLNNDGCIEVLGTINDCNGKLSLSPEAIIGLSALRAPGRVYRDVRINDFNGDSITDLITNVYSDLSDPASTALLYFGNGNGTFSQATQSQFTTFYGGYGETVVSADFDNDGDLDVFMPNYTYYSAQAQNYLFQNQGNGTFVEIADAAGVAMRDWPQALNPEGAQALDINQDGFIDIYSGSHLYINNGNMAFTDKTLSYGLPFLFDEGAKFFDWNNDGKVDLILHDPNTGQILFQFDGNTFSRINNVFQSRYYSASYGLNTEDVDGDGFQDIIIAGGYNPDGSNQNPTLFLKRQNGYVLSNLRTGPTGWSDIAGFADFDRNGTMDIMLRAGNLHYMKNTASDSSSIKVSMFGAGGEKNQQGRIVRATSPNKPGFIMTRSVDGGSGYLSNNEYQLTFPTPNGNSYWISAQYDNGIVGGWATAGSNVKIYRDGRFIVTPR